MGVKTVCEDIFSLIYRQALKKGKVAEEFGKKVGELENIVHSLRLFQYLLLIAEGLEIEKPQEADFAKAFRTLFGEVLKSFCERYMENENCEDFSETFLRGTEIEMGNIGDVAEDAIILLLGLIADKTLSEHYAVPKIRNLLRELQGKNLPLL